MTTMTEVEMYERLEQDGREHMERWQKNYQHRSDNRKHPGTKAAIADQYTADRYAEQLKDTGRYLWCITIGGYGEMYWVGSRASAEGRRIAKAKWEGAHFSNCTKVRPAREDEPNGDAEKPVRHAAALASDVGAGVSP